jgi:hypothetical protein
MRQNPSLRHLSRHHLGNHQHAPEHFTKASAPRSLNASSAPSSHTKSHTGHGSNSKHWKRRRTLQVCDRYTYVFLLVEAYCVQVDQIKGLKGELKEAILEKRAIVKESAEDAKERLKR